jgi:hypothetical protein
MNGANGMSDMEGKVTRVGAIERAANEFQSSQRELSEITVELAR